MTADEHKAKINAAGGIIGDLVRKFLNKKRLAGGLHGRLESRYCRICTGFLDFCAKHGFNTPCQELYDLATEDRSRTYFSEISQLTRFIDAEAETRAVNRRTGLPLNEDLNTDEAECDAFFAAAKPPLDRAPAGFVLVMALRGLELFENTESTKSQNLRMFRLFAEYCRANHGGWCCAEAADGFAALKERQWRDKKILYWKLKLARRTATIAKEILKTGSHSRWYLKEKVPAMSGGLEEARKQIAELCRACGNKAHTAQTIDYGFRKFTELAGIRSAGELRECPPLRAAEAVTKLNSCCTTAGSRLAVAGYIRRALSLLFEAGATKHDLSRSVMIPRQVRNKVIGYLSGEDGARLVSWLEEGNESLRNRAVILLALRLGLRSSDIRALRFEDIDWKKEKISIVQRKTGEPLTLPLLPEVGNAVWDYITKERPRVSCPCVFIRAQAPYSPLTDCYGFISCILKKLKITPVNRGTLGPHVLRHTLIKDLLHQEIPHQHITDVLGHRSRDSDRSYYAIAEEKLRECALDLSLIGMPVWMKGADHE